MAKYINAFLIPVPKKSVKIYTEMAKKSAKAWLKHGALEYVDSLGDGLEKGKITSFPRSVKMKPTETVAFGYVAFRSSAHCDQVMAKIMKDEAIMKMWQSMPFDGMRMIMGGFKVIARG